MSGFLADVPAAGARVVASDFVESCSVSDVLVSSFFIDAIVDTSCVLESALDEMGVDPLEDSEGELVGLRCADCESLVEVEVDFKSEAVVPGIFVESPRGEACVLMPVFNVDDDDGIMMDVLVSPFPEATGNVSCVVASDFDVSAVDIVDAIFVAVDKVVFVLNSAFMVLMPLTFNKPVMP